MWKQVDVKGKNKNCTKEIEYTEHILLLTNEKNTKDVQI